MRSRAAGLAECTGISGGRKPCSGLFDPGNHVVAGAPFVVAKVVIEADFAHDALLQQGDGLVAPVDA
ncbi:hypothetical protein [Tahibacter aquaticus]|uniref:hypothetical protein n=1 Tax=Tahibacter aquaticus TaxID=520092 RepID=UPI001AAD1941|nr:hypothetical protein [Tahibacter aquaticus]